jgi:protein-export membrane protein SecD
MVIWGAAGSETTTSTDDTPFNDLKSCIVAGVIGLLAVMLFMILFYRLPGLVASLALTVYTIIDLWIMSLTGLTLTLPGIAGVLLSVGMAVDSNCIIFERFKEEYRLGSSLRVSMNSGFDKAIKAITDANVATVIAAVILWVLGTGQVQGFAKTLVVGIILSVFTEVVFTKYLLNLVIDMRVKNKWLFGLRKAEL